MTALAFLAMLAALAVGVALGWFAHAARTPNAALTESALNAAGDVAARTHSAAIAGQVSALLEPLQAAVAELNETVDDVETQRIQAYAGLREQVAGMHRVSSQLNSNTGQLVAALRAPTVRGRWGEVQLQRVVELAGMTKHCDFSTQYSLDGARPDLVVHLSGDRHVVVDAKTPLSAYLDSLDQADEAQHKASLAQHARQLRAHVDALAGKSYWELFANAPEFTVMFVPSDAFLDAALGADPGLLDHAFARNIVLATPTTLIALLRTVAFTWRQEKLTDEAARIQQLGRELYTRLGTAAEHLDRLGRQLGKSVESYNQTVASMESRVWVTARKLHEMDLYEPAVPGVSQVQNWPRAVSTGNLSGQTGHAIDHF